MQTKILKILKRNKSIKETYRLHFKNIMRSTQIFNEIYEKDSRSSQRGIK